VNPAPPKTTNAAVQAPRALHDRRRQRVLAAITQTAADGTELTVSAVARAAGVDRSYLYRHRDLLEQLHAGYVPGTGF
jgi:AcrR family transcriptional regulator